MFKHAWDRLLLAMRLKLGIGTPKRLWIFQEPTAVQEVQDPIDIEIALRHVLPEALA